MSLFEHLAELRTRLSRVVVVVLVLGTFSLAFAREIYGFLMRPVLVSLPAQSAQLVYTSAIEELNVLMKIGLYAGVFLATPVLLWQIWGFVSPGLYDNEKKMAGPFIVFGTLAFVAGAAFCYFVLLPQMFQFLLQREDVAVITQRIDTGKLREQDALRYLSLGDIEHAGALARTAVGDLQATGEGKTTDDGMGLSLLNKRSVDVMARLEGLGRLVDATHAGFGDAARPVLTQVMAKRLEAIAAFGQADFDKASSLADEGAALLAGVSAPRASDFSELWKLERTLSVGVATVESMNWTKPMLSMSEQLSLVLVLELAFGLIFELPLVMMVLGMVGLVSSAFLFKYQRHALVVCLIAAAVITPTGDAVNLALMAGPMLLCYELGVVLVWLVEKRRQRQADAPPA
ncbi:MAG: twin-arginine translocase subunit TatC [Myxococcaceae bacterium]|nr:twin-arginine translocase subunit TatC [Myxococcaceae bacterium]